MSSFVIKLLLVLFVIATIGVGAYFIMKNDGFSS